METPLLSRAEKDHAYHQTHREARLAYGRQYRLEHREELRAKDLARDVLRREANRLYAQQYRLDNGEMLREKARNLSEGQRERRRLHSRESHSRHRASRCTQKRLFYAAHPDIVAQQARQSRQKHQDRVLEGNARRRAQQRSLAVHDFTAAQWREMKAAYGFCCVYCGRKMQRLTMDHLTPLCEGGAHTASNIVPACQSCNSKKGTRGVLIPTQPLLLMLAPPRLSKEHTHVA